MASSFPESSQPIDFISLLFMTNYTCKSIKCKFIFEKTQFNRLLDQIN